MKNKLFLTCPFSNMEHFIRKKFGNDVFFTTCMGGVVPLKDKDYISAVSEFIRDNNIEAMCIVNDTDCRFICNIIDGEPLYGTRAEDVLLNIYLDHHDEISQIRTRDGQRLKLAELNVHSQLHDLSQNQLLNRALDSINCKLIGLITTKTSNRISEINLVHQYEQ